MLIQGDIWLKEMSEGLNKNAESEDEEDDEDDENVSSRTKRERKTNQQKRKQKLRKLKVSWIFSCMTWVLPFFNKHGPVSFGLKSYAHKQADKDVFYVKHLY